MSSCLINTAQLTTNVDRQLLIAFVVRMWRVNLGWTLIGNENRNKKKKGRDGIFK